METLGIGNCFGPVFVSRAVGFQVWVQGCRVEILYTWFKICIKIWNAKGTLLPSIQVSEGAESES